MFHGPARPGRVCRPGAAARPDGHGRVPAPKADRTTPPRAVPAAKSERADLEDQIYAALRTDHYWTPSDRRRAVWVGEVKDHLLLDVLFKSYTDGAADFSVHARKAEIHVDGAHKRMLIHVRKAFVSGATERTGWVFFEDRVLETPIPPAAAEGQTEKQREKPRPDAAIHHLGFPAFLSLMGERLDPPGTMSLIKTDSSAPFSP